MTAEENYWSSIFRKRVSRRQALTAGVGASLGYAGLSLLGCQSGRPSTSQPATSSTPSSTSSTTFGKIPVPTSKPKLGGTLREHGWEPVHWDPNQTASGMTQSNFSKVFTPITTLRHGPQYAVGDFTVEPWMAESWEIPDQTTYIFHLRKGIKYHDVPPVNGRELTSEDIKYTIARVSDKDTGNPELQYRVEDIVSVETPDNYTVKIKLKQPVASFLQFTAGTPFLITPHESVEKYGDLKRAESCIGAGPWILDRYEPKVGSFFRKHPDFFLKGLPYLDRLEAHYFGDGATLLAALRTGNLDLGPIGRTDLESLKQTNQDMQYDEFWAPNFLRITFRLDKPPFNDVRVRRAASLAIDYNAYIKSQLLGVGQRVGPLTPSFGPAFLPYEDDPASAKWYNYDPVEAKRLLAEAGYPDGFETTLNSTAGYGSAVVDIAELVTAFLSKVGIKVKIDLKEYAAFLASTGVGKFEGLGGPISIHAYGDPDYYLWAFFYPGSPTNHGNLNDPELNKMLEKMKSEFNLTERIKVIQDISKRIRDNVYQLALPTATSIYAVQPYVKNFVSMARLTCVGNWGKETLEAWIDK